MHIVVFMLFAGLLAACSPQSSEPGQSRSEAAASAEILALLDHFLEGAARSDAAIHEAFWHEKLVYTSSSGTRFGKPELMTGLQPLPAEEVPAIRYRAEDAEVRFFAETALLHFTLVAEEEAGTLRFLNSGVLIRADDRWQVVNWQATRVP